MNIVTLPIRFHAGLAILLLVVSGCNDAAKDLDAVVQGSVTIDGELAERGTVTFHPTKSGPVAYGTILKDGTYILRVGQGNKDTRKNKIYSGNYIATVASNLPSVSSENSDGEPPVPGPRLIDAKFSQKDTSKLKYQVKSGRNIINISVEQALPPAPDTEDADAETVAEATTEESDPPASTEPETENSEPQDEQQDADPKPSQEEPAQ